MNLRQLQYFVRVFEMQNMTRAAKSLYAAQPALSQQIALLEEDLGIRLLVRGSKGVHATTEGVLLYRHAQIILRHVDSTRSLLANRRAMAVQRFRNLAQGHLKTQPRRNLVSLTLGQLSVPHALLHFGR